MQTLSVLISLLPGPVEKGSQQHFLPALLGYCPVRYIMSNSVNEEEPSLPALPDFEPSFLNSSQQPIHRYHHRKYNQERHNQQQQQQQQQHYSHIHFQQEHETQQWFYQHSPDMASHPIHLFNQNRHQLPLQLLPPLNQQQQHQQQPQQH